MDSLTGISRLRFWWINRRFAVRDGAAEQHVLSKLGAPVEKERTNDGEWWKYRVYHGSKYDVSYSILMNAGAVIISVWGSSLRRRAGAG